MVDVSYFYVRQLKISHFGTKLRLSAGNRSFTLKMPLGMRIILCVEVYAIAFCIE